MRKWAHPFAPLLLSIAVQPASAGESSVLLVKGQIESTEYMSGLFPALGDQEPTIEGGDYRIKLKITEALIGTPRQQELYLTLRMPADRAKKPAQEIFLLAEQLPGGQLQPVDWDFAENGVCIDNNTAIAYGIEEEIEAVEKKYPCK
jgi:hypothetical protein